MAEEAVGYKRAEVERERIDFQLHRVGEHAYLLVNDGTDDAYGVRVDMGAFHMHEAATDFEVFASGHSEEYLLLFSYGEQSTHIGITWHHQPDQSDTEQSKRLYVEH